MSQSKTIVMDRRGKQITNNRGATSIRADLVGETRVSSPSSLKIVSDSAPQIRIATSERAAKVRIDGRTKVVARLTGVGTIIVDPGFNPLILRCRYAATFAPGQLGYIIEGVLYPVTRSMPQAVSNLIGVAIVAGVAGNQYDVVLEGRIQNVGYSLFPGRVFIGDDGFPTSINDEDKNYTPIGYSDGGDSYFFSAADERYFR